MSDYDGYAPIEMYTWGDCSRWSIRFDSSSGLTREDIQREIVNRAEPLWKCPVKITWLIPDAELNEHLDEVQPNSAIRYYQAQVRAK